LVITSNKVAKMKRAVDGVAGDDGMPKHYGHVVTCDGCEGNECMPLGEAKKTQYQRREIGEGDWEDCTKSQFEYCENHPLYDTRKL
jgi:hypothetical protein